MEGVTGTLDKTRGRHSQGSGIKSSVAFGGDNPNPVLQLVYGESAGLFAGIIKARAKPASLYSVGDIGSYRGDLTKKIIPLINDLPGEIVTVGFDRAKHLSKSPFDVKVPCDLTDLQCAREIDFGWMRYVLHQNTFPEQRKILAGVYKILKSGGFVILQHVGADPQKTAQWREVIHNFFLSGKIPALIRQGNYYSTREEVEGLLQETGFNFELLSETRCDGLSVILSQRYSKKQKELMEKEALMRREFGEMDYIYRVTWVITK